MGNGGSATAAVIVMVGYVIVGPIKLVCWYYYSRRIGEFVGRTSMVGAAALAWVKVAV